MNGFGGITFQNIPAVSSPGGLVAAAEGLTIDPLNPGTVLFGGDSSNPGYFSDPFNNRIIETEGAGIVLQSVYDSGWFISMWPGVLEMSYGLNSFGADLSWGELDSSFATMGLLTNQEYVNTSGPLFYLINNQGANNSDFELQAYDDGTDPYRDGYLLFHLNSGRGMKHLTNQVPISFSTNYEPFSSPNPYPDMTIDYQGAALVEVASNQAGQVALFVQQVSTNNTQPVAHFIGGHNQLRLQTNTTDDTRLELADMTGSIRGFLAWASSVDTVTLQSGNDIRLRQAATDRVRVAGNQVYVNAPLRVGSLTGAAAARLDIVASTGAANTAPLRFNAGTLLASPSDGCFEYDGTDLYFTVGGVRKTVQLI